MLWHNLLLGIGTVLLVTSSLALLWIPALLPSLLFLFLLILSSPQLMNFSPLRLYLGEAVRRSADEVFTDIQVRHYLLLRFLWTPSKHWSLNLTVHGWFHYQHIRFPHWTVWCCIIIAWMLEMIGNWNWNRCGRIGNSIVVCHITNNGLFSDLIKLYFSITREPYFWWWWCWTSGSTDGAGDLSRTWLRPIRPRSDQGGTVYWLVMCGVAIDLWSHKG